MAVLLYILTNTESLFHVLDRFVVISLYYTHPSDYMISCLLFL